MCLVSRGKDECWAGYNSTTGEDYGYGYVNPCIRSGVIRISGDLPSSWYNYVLASAGTIKNINAYDGTGTMEKAMESVCPKGWTLPDNVQLSSNHNTADFNPVLGGNYGDGVLSNETQYGAWWGSETYYASRRNALLYRNSNLSINYALRVNGYYIRCVPAP